MTIEHVRKLWHSAQLYVLISGEKMGVTTNHHAKAKMSGEVVEFFWTNENLEMVFSKFSGETRATPFESFTWQIRIKTNFMIDYNSM